MMMFAHTDNLAKLAWLFIEPDLDIFAPLLVLSTMFAQVIIIIIIIGELHGPNALPVNGYHNRDLRPNHNNRNGLTAENPSNHVVVIWP